MSFSTYMPARSLAASLLLAAGFLSSAQAAVIRVGPDREIKTIAEASKRAVSGDVVEIDAGDYRGDVAVWSQSRLDIRAVGGRARLLADGKNAEGKGIWVIRGDVVTVRGIEFHDAAVPDTNGAGIRLEKGYLSVTDCLFKNNQMGILTGNNNQTALEVENSEFSGYDGTVKATMHNLYVGAIARLAVRGSYFHHARTGHLLKSRAALSVITYNRLTDETGGRASYELEFPNGGIAVVVGNIIEQSAATENNTIISFGAEGIKYEKNALYLAFNTLADDHHPAGTALRVKGGDAVRVVAYNNLLAGGQRWDAVLPPNALSGGNLEVRPEDFVQYKTQDFRLSPAALRRAAAVPIPSEILLDADLREKNLFLTPSAEYDHPAKTKSLETAPTHPGAIQSGSKQP